MQICLLRKKFRGKFSRRTTLRKFLFFVFRQRRRHGTLLFQSLNWVVYGDHDGQTSISGFIRVYGIESATFKRLWHSPIQCQYIQSLFAPIYLVPSQYRSMTTSKRVQDRSKKKRIHDLEIVVEKSKITSKVLFLMEVLKQEPEKIMPLRSMNQYRMQINLPKHYKLSDFLQKSLKLFELYKDQKGMVWCGMTEKAEKLIEEEERIIEEHSENLVEYVTRFLMMTVDKRLPLAKIAHFRRDFGLPMDFRENWVYKYPRHFKVVKNDDRVEFLELVSWNPAWAITELEKKVTRVCEPEGHQPGMLSLAFPLKFLPNYKQVSRYGGSIDHFQRRSYLSPYADASELKAGSLEFDKRAVALIHELLSFTIEKILAKTDHLTHFRRELVMPQKLMRLLLKHIGIFYVSERGKRFSVFLTEAYEGSNLIEKLPLVLWKEKVLSLTGYRGRKKENATFDEFAETEDDNLFESDSEEDNVSVQTNNQDTIGGLEDSRISDQSEMEMGEISRAYEDIKSS